MERGKEPATPLPDDKPVKLVDDIPKAVAAGRELNDEMSGYMLDVALIEALARATVKGNDIKVSDR